MKQLAILLSFSVMISCSESNNHENNGQLADEQLTAQTETESMAEVVDHKASESVVVEVVMASTEGEEMVTEVEASETTISVGNTGQLNRETEAKSKAEQAPEMTAEVAPQPTNVPLKPNHEKWDILLKKNVSSSGKVNYSGMKGSMDDLESYVAYLESFNTRGGWSKNEKLAYWINLYNAATVRLICQNYPVGSITDLSGGKPWDQNIVKVGTQQYSLNDIENSIIRPRFKEARIHFAVNCAAKSCPPIMNSAFIAEKLSRQLEKQTTSFINSSENTITADKVELSKIFDWYKDDFEKGNLIEFLNKYSTTPINSDARISFKTYNWDLNK